MKREEKRNPLDSASTSPGLFRTTRGVVKNSPGLVKTTPGLVDAGLPGCRWEVVGCEG